MIFFERKEKEKEKQKQKQKIEHLQLRFAHKKKVTSKRTN